MTEANTRCLSAIFCSIQIESDLGCAVCLCTHSNFGRLIIAHNQTASFLFFQLEIVCAGNRIAKERIAETAQCNSHVRSFAEFIIIQSN